MQAIPDYGMATIWGADILIWAASTLNRMKQQGLDRPGSSEALEFKLRGHGLLVEYGGAVQLQQQTGSFPSS